jgi:hypothetical protein
MCVQTIKRAVFHTAFLTDIGCYECGNHDERLSERMNRNPIQSLINEKDIHILSRICGVETWMVLLLLSNK